MAFLNGIVVLAMVAAATDADSGAAGMEVWWSSWSGSWIFVLSLGWMHFEPSVGISRL